MTDRHFLRGNVLEVTSRGITNFNFPQELIFNKPIRVSQELRIGSNWMLRENTAGQLEMLKLVDDNWTPKFKFD